MMKMNASMTRYHLLRFLLWMYGQIARARERLNAGERCIEEKKDGLKKGMGERERERDTLPFLPMFS